MVNEQAIQNIRSNVACLLRAERERQGFSLNALAGKAGLSRQMVAFVESGERNPSLDTLLRLTAALNIKLEDLLRRARKTSSAK